MSYKNFIAAINIGTSQITGMVGFVDSNNLLEIIASHKLSSDGCIRRGCVNNVEETAGKIKELIRQLERNLKGSKIEKVYVGVGGHSIRSIEYSVTKEFETERAVTEDDIQALYNESRNYKPELLDVLAAVSPVYLLDGKKESHPVGVPCTRIEAKYKLIIARPSLKRHVINSIQDKAGVEIADIIVSPLVLSDVILSVDQKNLGCAIINFGAGVTTLSIYNKGLLVDLIVIPFGGNTITKDITSLNITEAEAERIKIEYGSVITNQDDETTITINGVDGLSEREIRKAELCNIIEARAKEIIDNINDRLEKSGEKKHLGAGLIFTGEAENLRGITSLAKQKTNMAGRIGAIRKGLLKDEFFANGNPEFAEVIGVLLKGKEASGSIIISKQVEEPTQASIFDEIEEEIITTIKSPVEEVSKQKRENKKEKTRKKSIIPFGDLFGKMKSSIDEAGNNFFNDDPEAN